MFVGARTEVYNGMIFGEHSKDTDLDCNPCNAKHVSNVRTAGKDEFIQVRCAASCASSRRPAICKPARERAYMEAWCAWR